MRFILSIIVLIVVLADSSPSVAQIRIDSINYMIRNIPMDDGGQVSPWNLNYVFHNVTISGDSITATTGHDGTSIKLILDTATRQVREVSTYFEFGSLADQWGTHTTFLDSIKIKQFSTQYRSYAAGSDLTGHFVFLINLKRRIGSNQFAEENIVSRPDLYSDTSSIELILYGQIPLEVVPTEKPHVSYYPNPARSLVHLESSDLKAQSARLVDLLGRIVRTFELSGLDSHQLSLINIPAGHYYLFIENNTLPLVIE